MCFVCTKNEEIHIRAHTNRLYSTLVHTLRPVECFFDEALENNCCVLAAGYTWEFHQQQKKTDNNNNNGNHTKTKSSSMAYIYEYICMVMRMLSVGVHVAQTIASLKF